MINNNDAISFGAIKYPIKYARIHSNIIPELEDKALEFINRASGTQKVVLVDTFIENKDGIFCISDYGSKSWDKFMIKGLKELGIPVEYIKQNDKAVKLLQRIFG